MKNVFGNQQGFENYVGAQLNQEFHNYRIHHKRQILPNDGHDIKFPKQFEHKFGHEFGHEFGIKDAFPHIENIANNFKFELPKHGDHKVAPHKPEFHHPEPEYHPPEPEYHLPEPEYHPPEPEYHPPEHGYRPPVKPVFHPPKPEFHPPAKPVFHPPEPEYHPPSSPPKHKPYKPPKKPNFKPPKLPVSIAHGSPLIESGSRGNSFEQF